MQRKSSTDVFGIDVSNHNGNIAWASVNASGVKFVYAKATEGKTFDDPLFAAHVKGARSVGLPVGAYHFARPETNDAVTEANHFITVMKKVMGNYGDLLPVLDIESPSPSGSKLTGAFLSMWALAFVNEVKRQTGRDVILYTGGWYVNGFGVTGLSNIPLWISNYNPCVNGVPDCGGWTQWTIWQYTDKGKIAGINGNVDLNVAVSLDAITGTVTIPPSPTATKSVVSANASLPNVILRKGDKGNAVKAVQSALNSIGFSCGTADGIFGPATGSALKRFQGKYGLGADGVYGPKTKAKMEALLK